jgi:hypothetical protein
MISVINFFENQEYPLYESEFIKNTTKDIVKQYKIKMNELTQKLIEAKIDLNKTNKIIKNHSNKLKEEIGSGNINSLRTHFIQILDEIKESSIFLQLTKSILLIYLVYILNTFLINSMIEFGIEPTISFIIGAIFIFPLIEETSKFFSIKQKMTGIYYFVFNFFEYSLYLCKYLSLGAMPIALIISRITSMIMHAVTTGIQWSHKNTSPKLGLLLGIIVHSLWNFFAVLPQILSSFLIDEKQLGNKNGINQ